jgi:hypothetical protein
MDITVQVFQGSDSQLFASCIPLLILPQNYSPITVKALFSKSVLLQPYVFKNYINHPWKFVFASH